MYNNLTDIANCSLPNPERYGLAPKDAYFLGVSTEEHHVRSDPEHSTFLYVSTRRPLGIWFNMDTPHTMLGGSRRAGVVGTSEPLTMETLRSYELTPFTNWDRAATVVRAWDEDGRPTLASATPDGNGGMRQVHMFLQMPQHTGDMSLVTFDERGPVGHMCYSEPDPIWEPGADTVMKGVMSLLRGERQMIPSSFAEDMIDRWTHAHA